MVERLPPPMMSGLEQSRSGSGTGVMDTAAFFFTKKQSMVLVVMSFEEKVTGCGFTHTHMPFFSFSGTGGRNRPVERQIHPVKHGIFISM